jgi:uncharacterized integral membrane protein
VKFKTITIHYPPSFDRAITMKSLSTILVALIVAAWMGATAVFAVQNFSPVSLRFLQFESFQMPIGVVLGFSAGLGVVGMALLQPLLSGSGYDDEES